MNVRVHTWAEQLDIYITKYRLYSNIHLLINATSVSNGSVVLAYNLVTILVDYNMFK